MLRKHNESESWQSWRQFKFNAQNIGISSINWSKWCDLTSFVLKIGWCSSRISRWVRKCQTVDVSSILEFKLSPLLWLYLFGHVASCVYIQWAMDLELDLNDCYFFWWCTWQIQSPNCFNKFGWFTFVETSIKTLVPAPVQPSGDQVIVTFLDY